MTVENNENPAPENAGTDTSQQPAPSQQEDLSAKLADLQRQVDATNSKNQELLGKLSTLKQVQEQVDQFGGLDKVKELHEKHKGSEESTQSVIQQKDKYIQDLEGKLQMFQSTQVEAKVDSHIKDALKEYGLDEEFEILAPHLKSRVKGELVEGQVRIGILSDDKKSPLLKDGRDASVKDLVEEYSQRGPFAKLFGKKVSGTGKVPNASSSNDYTDPKSNPFTREGKNVAKQVELFKTDPKKAERLMNEANAMIGKGR